MRSKTIRKMLSLALAAAMSLSVIGCGAEEETTQPSESKQEESVTTEKTEEVVEEEPVLGIMDPYPEPVTITFGVRSEINAPTTEEELAVDGWAQLFKEKLNIEIEVEWEFPMGDEYNRQISLGMASGDLPDVFVNRDGYETLKELAEGDYIYDLTDLYEEYASDLVKDMYASNDNKALQEANVNGRLYALPQHNPYPSRDGIWFRQDWLDKLDITLDEDDNGMITLEELKDTAIAFKDANLGNAEHPYGFGGNLYCLMYMVGQNFEDAWKDGYFQKEDGTVIHGSTNDGCKEMLKWFQECYAEGLMDPEYATQNNAASREGFINGRCGILVGAWYWPNAEWKLTIPDAKYSYYLVENGEGNAERCMDSYSQFWHQVITKDCEHPEAVLKMMNLMVEYGTATPKEQEQMAPLLYAQEQAGTASGCVINIGYGWPSDQFKDYDGAMALIDGTMTEDDATAAQVTLRDAILAVEAANGDLLQVEDTLYTSYVQNVAPSEAWKKIYEKAEEEITTIITSKSPYQLENTNDLSGLYKEYYNKIITGVYDIDKYDEYVQLRYELGDEIICKELEEIVKAQQ